MATTARTIVDRSLRLLQITAAGETSSAEDASDGLEALNAMMHGWKAKGVDVAHVDLTLNEDFPLEPEYREGAAGLLAVVLAPEHGAQVSVAVALMAEEGWRSLLAGYPVRDDAVMPTELSHMPSRLWGYGSSR